MQNYITLDIGSFEMLMEDSRNNKTRYLKDHCTEEKFQYYHYVFNQGDTRNIFSQYFSFILRTSDPLLISYKNLYDTYESSKHYNTNLESVTISIETYLFCVSNEIVPADFNFDAHINYLISLRTIKAS